MSSIPTFIDISEDEQCEELREYMESLGGSCGKSESLVGDLKAIISVCDVVLRDSIKDADVESALNSIVSLLIASIPQSSHESLILVNAFCEQMLKSQNRRQSVVCLRVLKNLFGGLQDITELRFRVYMASVRLAASTNQIQSVFTDLALIKQWFPATAVGVERVQALLRLLHEALVAQKQSEWASRVMIELLSTYTEENASQARDDAHKCIVWFLGDKNTFLLDHLLALKPVKFLEGEPIHDLLLIFVAEKLSAYVRFYAAHRDFCDGLGLQHEMALQKMRLLTFMQMAESRKELPFDVIQTELQLNADQVEAFVIDVLRTRLVKAKVDQLGRRVLVSSTMHRTFGRAQWQHLRDTLKHWSGNLAHVQHTVHSGQQVVAQ